MIESILERDEGKTLEFKENAGSAEKIIKTVIAFANTAGGIIVIGIKDQTKEVVGVANVLREEERLTNLIADYIAPLLMPDFEITTYKNKELLLINVPYSVGGPYSYKKKGSHRGAVYIRLGSSSRQADRETIASLQRLSKNMSYDEMPCVGSKIDDLDKIVISKTLAPLFKKINKTDYQSLGIISENNSVQIPSNGGILLFGNNRLRWFPDSVISCVCFAGSTRSEIVDQKKITSHLVDSVGEIVAFIVRHTNVASEIGAVKRREIKQFPEEAVREAVINSVVHADYSVTGSSIQVAVFSDRIEITNPGGLPFGQTIEHAMTGVSRMRNRMIGRIFRELKLIERLGSGVPRIIEAYRGESALQPKFEDMDTFFRVTLYSVQIKNEAEKYEAAVKWQRVLLDALAPDKKLGTKQIAALWGVSDRAARARLQKMVSENLVRRNARSTTDPNANYSID